MNRIATVSVVAGAIAMAVTPAANAAPSAEAASSAAPNVAAAAAAPSAWTTIAEHVSTRTVLEGSMPGVRGNQHRLVFSTDTEGMQWPASAARIDSYFCPTGSRINANWTSPKCTKRSTSYLSYDREDYRVSDTLWSARIQGTLTSGNRAFDADLVLRGHGSLSVGTASDGSYRVQSRSAKVSGTVNGTSVRSDAREPSSIHRYQTP